ncbi:uncharacterized protein YukE [Stackebrandtia albiflava]|uniref:Uncharacterized protein YukE n=1 Tax=Stackebrandtia albiflava TaxID=406432 RepID=A0A562VBZ7_9ACTN|nr:hypothetical protein [Stackebrandtia albiflava]TWJ15404.1 uncharacterized protein YukE [Stackebrandtia albiflava]
MPAGIIAANFSQLADLEANVIQTGTELIQVVEQLMVQLQGMEWEAADRTAYQELQETWNSEDFSLQEILQQIGRQVGIASEGTQSTIMRNAAQFG